MASRKAAAPVASRKWLSIVGIGEDGAAGLGEAARRAIAEAEIIVGGPRHLALVASLGSAEAVAWPTPFDPELAALRAMVGRRVCVLASGDPFLYGVGATIARRFSPDEYAVFPAPSAFALAAARLGWPLQSIETVSLHGRPLSLLRPLLQPGRRVLALTPDDRGPASIADYLKAIGFGKSILTIMERLGGPDERIRSCRAAEFALEGIARLNLVGIEVEAGRDAAPLPLTPGLPDEAFEHDGQITKRDMRAITLGALSPRRGELLWDVGAGAGSVAVEWLLADPSMRAVAIEADAARAERIGRNAKRLGVPGLLVVAGTAPGAFDGLEAPDAVFIGGGGSDPGVVEGVIEALRAGGRLVANAVTLEMEHVLLDRHARLGGELVRIAIAQAAPVGAMHGWRAAMPVTQWRWVKP